MYREASYREPAKAFKPKKRPVDYGHVALRILAGLWFFGTLASGILWIAYKHDILGTIFVAFLSFPIWGCMVAVTGAVVFGLIYQVLSFIVTGEV
jgi:hypothetical protein